MVLLLLEFQFIKLELL